MDDFSHSMFLMMHELPAGKNAIHGKALAYGTQAYKFEFTG